mmetsp:Transcript_3554/g.13607  ORF Transcript_3554/g.13607 Transcript_3554/m.13607 type:complete len:236 (+) Transcript_3554:1054-1761(+)
MHSSKIFERLLIAQSELLRSHTQFVHKEFSRVHSRHCMHAIKNECKSLAMQLQKVADHDKVKHLPHELHPVRHRIDNLHNEIAIFSVRCDSNLSNVNLWKFSIHIGVCLDTLREFIYSISDALCGWASMLIVVLDAPVSVGPSHIVTCRENKPSQIACILPNEVRTCRCAHRAILSNEDSHWLLGLITELIHKTCIQHLHKQLNHFPIEIAPISSNQQTPFLNLLILCSVQSQCT